MFPPGIPCCQEISSDRASSVASSGGLETLEGSNRGGAVPETAMWLLGVGLFAVGIVLGFAMRIADRSRTVRERELREQLAEEREKLATYKAQVTRHMDQTAHLFRDLTNQHAALYDHLAQGARELAPKPERLGGQAFGPALVEFASQTQGTKIPDSVPRIAAPPEARAPRVAAPPSPTPTAAPSPEPTDDPSPEGSQLSPAAPPDPAAEGDSREEDPAERELAATEAERATASSEPTAQPQIHS